MRGAWAGDSPGAHASRCYPRRSMTSPNAENHPLLEAVRKLVPMIRTCADEIDRERELPRPLFEALADAGVFHMAIPRSLGGGEIDLPTYALVIEELGKAAAST